MNGYYIAAIAIFLVGAFFILGWQKIPADPPHLGVVTKMGERTNKVLKEGWRFIWWYPFYNFILVKVEKIAKEFVSPKTRTPDRAESRVPIFTTISPDPENLIEYLDNGGEEGVLKQLEGILLERIREWAMGPEEGPRTWVELNQSRLEAVSILLKKIAGDNLAKIPDEAQAVPTWIWLRYTQQPRPTVFFKNEEKWKRNKWKMVEDTVTKLKLAGKYDELMQAVEARRGQVMNLSQGTGEIKLCGLGCIMERLNLGDIEVLGEVAKKAEGEAKEEQERILEEKEMAHTRKEISKNILDLGLEKMQAVDLFQSERGKITRVVDDKRISLDSVSAGIFGTALAAAIKGVGNSDAKNEQSKKPENGGKANV